MALALDVCGPKPSTMWMTHQSGLSRMTGIWRMPWTMEGAICTHASSVMKALFVMTSVEPSAAPWFTRNASS